MNDDQIFEQAILMQDPEKRVRFIEESCSGDKQRSSFIQDLVNSYFSAGEFLDRSPVGLPTWQNAESRNGKSSTWNFEKAGDSIGPFKLEEEIGRGGMAVVFRAFQEQPIQRHVAVKMIKPGLETEQILSRMRFERQALARMNHRGIAAVYDAGISTLGRPYFVMELVDGKPITEFCRIEKLDHRRKVKLLIDVCHAVEHAHRHGIIHRDLKPSNILITCDGQNLVPKIIDFGIAKALSPEPNLNDTLTALGQIVGTPQYMSPEQAAVGSHAIDIRTDVYSLGATLYELVTGNPPIISDTVVETLNRIANQDPLPPSRLNRSVDRDLETICLRCLRKDPDRRYGTAGALADDLTRWLSGKPIAARPIGTFTRIGKWARRSPAAAALAVVCMLALVVFIGLWVAFTFQLKNQRDQITKAASQLKIEKEYAIANFERAHDAIHQYLVTMRSHTPLGSTRDLYLRESFLESGMEFYDKLVGEGDNSPVRAPPERLVDIQFERAELYLEHGKTLAAALEFERAIKSIQTAEQMLKTMLREGRADMGKIWVYLGSSHGSLAITYVKADKTEIGETYARKSVDDFENAAQSNTIDAGYKNWYLARSRNRLGEVLVARNEYEAALAAYRDALEFGKQLTRVDDFQLTLANSHLGIGRSLFKLAKTEEALKELSTAQAVIEAVCVQSTPTLPRYVMCLVNILTEIARCQKELELTDESVQTIERAIELQTSLFRNNSHVEQLGMELAELLECKGELLSDPEAKSEALEESDRIIDELNQRGISASDPLMRSRMLMQGIAKDLARHKYSRACQRLERVYGILESIQNEKDQDELTRLRKGVSFNLGLVKFQLADYKAAHRYFLDCEKMEEKALDKVRPEFALCLAELGDVDGANQRIENLDTSLPSNMLGVSYLPLIRLHSAILEPSKDFLSNIQPCLAEAKKLYANRKVMNNLQYRSFCLGLCRMIELLEQHFPSNPESTQFIGWAKPAAVDCVRKAHEKDSYGWKQIINDQRLNALADFPEFKALTNDNH